MLQGIDPQTIAEWVVYTILWVLAAIATGAIWSFVHMREKKQDYQLRHNETHDAERNAMKLMMRDRLSDLAIKYRTKGFVSETEFTDATEHYETYKSLYGNSFGDSIYEEIEELHKRGRK